MHLSKQTRHTLHPFYEEQLVRHALRKIKGGKLLCDRVYNKERKFRQRLAEFIDMRHDGLKAFWN